MKIINNIYFTNTNTKIIKYMLHIDYQFSTLLTGQVPTQKATKSVRNYGGPDVNASSTFRTLVSAQKSISIKVYVYMKS